MILPSSTVLLLFAVTVLSSSNTINAWLTVPEKNIVNQRSRCLLAHINDNNERYHRGEIIGATGKIGSYLLDAINSPAVTPTDGQSTKYPQCQPVAATPRGVAPGCLSPDDTPIYACVPSSSIASVWDATVPHRRKDLVFLCNCIPSRHLNFDSSVGDGDFTICIIHFGVTHKMNSASSQLLPLLNTSPQSPPTVIFGRHATTLSDILRRDGISVEIAPTSQHLQMAAAKKLAWSSLFWLLCHDGKEPITVKVVWERKLKQIHELVEEMMPALESLANESWMNNDTEIPSKKEFSTVEEVVDYLYRYSYSMKDGKITPSLDLALDEISERNGVLLSTMLKLQSDAKDRTSKQLELVRRVAGEENLRRCLDTPDKRTGNDHDSIVSPERVSCIASNLQFLFSPTPKTFVNDDFKNSKPSVVIIGAGIIGSSLAYHLSRLGDVKVSVLDKSTNLLPREAKDDNDDNNDGFSPGVATSSSFAWLNANDKSPLSYMQLNHLGMEMWRRHDFLKEFPVWCGALLRKPKQSIEEDRSSAYVCVGPLNCSDANDLEPGLQMGDESEESSEFYFYPEEGYVEPSNVVKALRGSGHRNGVHFIGGSEVVSLIRNNSGSVVGVEYTTSNDSAIHRVEANVVVAASGASFAVASLVGEERLPLSKQPGALAYINSDSVDNYFAHPLSRIYVDTIKQTHILRRPNGTLVIGGGKLITGGTTGINDSTTGNEEFDTLMADTTKDTAIGIEMISAALSAPPHELASLANSSRNENGFRVTKANRPISADGLPIVGFSERGLYVAVTHSGITLAPLIGELASYEIRASLGAQRKEPSTNQEMYGFQILDAYRPSRFS